ncbi:MAG: hypothetical protein ACW98F_13865 [Candidatus Hodarchaeales archaeon]|jgi:hypothetical protein
MLGVFLAGLTKLGPDVIAFSDGNHFTAELKKEVAMKSIPMSGKSGDFVSVSIQDFQAVSILLLVPAFESGYDQRDSFVAFGVLVSQETNPTTFNSMLKTISSVCMKYGCLDVPSLIKLVPKLHNLPENKILEIKPGVEIDIGIDTTPTSGDRLRTALKRL